MNERNAGDKAVQAIFDMEKVRKSLREGFDICTSLDSELTDDLLALLERAEELQNDIRVVMVQLDLKAELKGREGLH